MKIEIPELKTQHMTAAEKRACVEGMGHVIFHFQREAAYLFINGGRDGEVMAERLRDMSTELMMAAGTIADAAFRMEADKARLDEIREEVEGDMRKAQELTQKMNRRFSGCIEDDGQCNCSKIDISLAHVKALEENRIRTANGAVHPRTYRRQ